MDRRLSPQRRMPRSSGQAVNLLSLRQSLGQPRLDMSYLGGRAPDPEVGLCTTTLDELTNDA
ncbi:MAG: hypothetical protein WD377_00475, partial [Nitriliruptoraceae bacterium]